MGTQEQGSDWNVMNSGEWSGIMASEDGGTTWDMVQGFPPNYYVTSILETAHKAALGWARCFVVKRCFRGYRMYLAAHTQ